MNESKSVLTGRLRREGRWDEASKFMDDLRIEFRKEGATRMEANVRAWEQMEAEYPPAPELEVSKEVTAVVAGPVNPWPNLPTKADFTEEVKWVHQQYALIVEETPKGRVIHWDWATEAPPSHGARSIAMWAADNRTAFYKDMLPRAMSAASGSGDEDELVREEKRSIAEVTKILEKIVR